jgi:6,7-dimethyl-8-ribityllumazine synthase
MKTDSRPSGADLQAAQRRFGIVASRFHADLCEGLLGGARACLAAHGATPAQVDVERVPGAWELPVALEWLAASGRYDALIALGVVIRGETSHFDYICNECSRGIASVSDRHGIPVAFGVLTCETVEQAHARAGSGPDNKGWEAALAALEMAALRERLAGVRR